MDNVIPTTNTNTVTKSNTFKPTKAGLKELAKAQSEKSELGVLAEKKCPLPKGLSDIPFVVTELQEVEYKNDGKSSFAYKAIGKATAEINGSDRTVKVTADLPRIDEAFIESVSNSTMQIYTESREFNGNTYVAAIVQTA